MGIGLGQRCLVQLSLSCIVCERHVLDDDDTAEIALFGAVPYAVCPGCRRIVGPFLMADPDYRRRARVRTFEDTGHVWPSP